MMLTAIVRKAISDDVNAVLAVLACIVSFALFGVANYSYDIVGILSQAAITASLGTALFGIADLLERDKLERVKLDVDILYRDIFKTDPWRRWPFLHRKSRQRNLVKDSITTQLTNPTVPFDVGTHTIEISIPTVQEDFFDLPIFENLRTLRKYYKAFLTVFGKGNYKHPGLGSTVKGVDAYSAYLCLLDCWRSILAFRIGRIIKVFSVSIILSTIAAMIVCLLYPPMLGCITRLRIR